MKTNNNSKHIPWSLGQSLNGANLVVKQEGTAPTSSMRSLASIPPSGLPNTPRQNLFKKEEFIKDAF